MVGWPVAADCVAVASADLDDLEGGGPSRWPTVLPVADGQHRAIAQAKRPQPFKFESNGPLAKEAACLLGLRWSPEQISKRLRRDHPGDERWWVSGEAIYQSLFIQGRGGVNSELTKALRSGRAKRRPKPPQDGRGHLLAARRHHLGGTHLPLRAGRRAAR
jgi:hypothetical protein